MNIFENILSSVRNVFTNKLRSSLTMLGIIIGISAVIIITSVGAGSQAQITENFNSMGVGRLIVRTQGNRNISLNDALAESDYDLLKADAETKFISPVYNDSATVKLLDPRETSSASIQGVMAAYEDIDKPTMLYGRYINDSDAELGAKTAVIHDTTAEKIFGYSNASVIGQKISIKTSRGSRKYTVIGVAENPNAEMARLYPDQYGETVTLPLSTAQRLFGAKYYSSIYIVVNDTDVINETADRVTAALDKAHGTTDKYYVQNMMTMMEQINSTMGMITMFISCVAGISLLVGGIGVMNIMLVTVTERTREIGIRKSIGAKNFDIKAQFLIEAITLTGIGGLSGLALGIGGGKIVGGYMDIQPVVSANSIALAVGISMLIGIVFGVYPASKAAKLDPIEALRYE
ncbi:MAG: ABC transporter permease [Clostridiales bacterium]|jgi:putative ABC transport system permease protein|nr:ABC transporter permease [Clostridiales bacterium]